MDILHIEQLLYNRRCPLSVLEPDARYNWWVMAPNMHHSPFLISYLCVLTHKAWKYRSYKDVLHTNDCSTIKGILWVVQSCMRDPTEEVQPQTCIDHSLMQHHVRILPAYTYITIWSTTMHDNEAHVPYDCILHTKRRLYCQQCIIL